MTAPDPARLHRLLLAGLCAALTLVAGLYFVRSLLKPDTGLVVNYPEALVSDGKVIFSPRAPFSAAAAAGLLPGRDQILSVDRAPIRSSRDLVQADARVRGFAPLSVEVLRDGTQRLTVALTPVFVPSRPDWLFVLAFCAVLAATAFSLALRQPGTTGSPLLVLAALLYLVFTCVKPFYYESFASNALIHAGKLAPWLLVAFGLYFPSPRGSRLLRAAVACALLAIWGGFTVSRLVLFARWAAGGTERFLEMYRVVGQAINAAEGVTYVAWGALMGSAYLRTRNPEDRIRLRWILAGILIALPPYFFLDQLPLILRNPGVRVSLGNLAQLFLVFIPACTLVGLTRQRHFSLRRFVSRVLLTAVMAGAAAGLFAGLYLPLRSFLGSSYRLASPVAELAAVLVLLALLTPLRWLLSRLADAALRGRGRAASADLERRNTELELRVAELQRQDARRHGGRRLQDLRTLCAAAAGTLREPVRRTTAALAALAKGQLAGPEIEAGARLDEVVQALDACGEPAQGPSAAVRAEALVTMAVEKTRRRHGGAGIAVRLDADPVVACVPGELVRVLCALLDNALEAQEGRPGQVCVHLYAEAGQAAVEVEDSGPGLDPRARRLLFSPFFSTRPGRQGLGLYRARAAVEAAGGTLEVGPGVDGGVRARVVLPLEGVQ